MARVSDIALDDDGRIVAVELGAAALVRRLGLRRLGARLDAERVAWERLGPARGHPGALQLRDGGPIEHVHRHRHRFPVMRSRGRAPL